MLNPELESVAREQAIELHEEFCSHVAGERCRFTERLEQALTERVAVCDSVSPRLGSCSLPLDHREGTGEEHVWDGKFPDLLRGPR